MDRAFRLDDRPLSKRDCYAASEVARRAFDDGPYFKFVFPN